MLVSASTWPRRVVAVLRAWLAPLTEWQFWTLLALLALGITLIAQQPFRYLIDIGYEEGWWSDRPLISGWNTGEPEHAKANERSYRWTAENSVVWLPGIGGRPLIATLDQLGAAAHPAVQTGVLHISATSMAVSQPLAAERMVYLFVPPAAARDGAVRFSAPTFTPPNDPRVLGAPVAKLEVAAAAQSWQLPPTRLFWPLALLAFAWTTGRRWCLTRGQALLGGTALVGILLLALWADRLRFAVAGQPLLQGAAMGLVVGLAVLWCSERWGPRLGVQPSVWFARLLALLVCWLVLLRYGGRLYPESMIGDLGFHVNRQNDVLRGLVHLTSLHRGIAFPYPSATYLVLAPLRLLPIDPYALVEWSDAVFGALGLLPVAYLALRCFRHERTALLVTLTYACLAPPMMALWWSFLSHIWAQEMIVVLLAVLVGMWRRLDTARGISVLVVTLCLVFFGHFGLYINVSLLLAAVLPVLWWRYRAMPELRRVYGLAIALVIAELLALGLFYSAYLHLIIEKLTQFGSGGMGAVQGGRAAISSTALLRSLWRDGLVAHYAVIGVPLAMLGGYQLWLQARDGLLSTLFWGTLVVAMVQASIPFLTSSTISTRWLSFCAWVVAVGVGIALDWLWRRGRLGQGAAIAVLCWIGGNTLWLWVQALGYRIRPPEPF